MHTRTALAALIAGTVLMTAAAAATTPVAAPDAAAIREVMARQADAWNRHDMDAYVAETTPDVEWVNVVGMHWAGRDTVKRAHIEGVGRTPDGSAYPDDGNIMTEVCVKTAQGWRIAHAHNTNIVARAAAHDPGKAPAR